MKTKKYNKRISLLLTIIMKSTVPLDMTQFTGQSASNYPKIITAMLTTVTPVIVFYFTFSKQIIKSGKRIKTNLKRPRLTAAF